jgi:hypothetical protein
VTPLLQVRELPLRDSRLVADSHLGGLARLLRKQLSTPGKTTISRLPKSPQLLSRKSASDSATTANCWSIAVGQAFRHASESVQVDQRCVGWTPVGRQIFSH